MFNIGQVCLKIAGRDAGKKCVVIDTLDDKYVLIEGETRRRKCNISHLEPLDQKLDISKNASHEVVMNLFGGVAKVRKTKPKTQKPKTSKKAKEKPELKTKKTVKADKSKK